jgi:hypothetical protein
MAWTGKISPCTYRRARSGRGTSECKLTLDAERVHLPCGGRAGQRILAVTALGAAGTLTATTQASATAAQDLRAFLSWAITSGTVQAAQVNFQPLPSSVVTLSDAQIARIKG